MTPSPKLEVLGRVSELARQVETPLGAGDAGEYLAAAMFALAHARSAGDAQQVREAVQLIAARCVNWLIEDARCAA